ncbi:MAG: hypothetical protein M3Q69_10995 [Acidobacteriota bacterium]|nr:hypothetical protein [Acidobacteriota bacterium]
MRSSTAVTMRVDLCFARTPAAEYDGVLLPKHGDGAAAAVLVVLRHST